MTLSVIILTTSELTSPFLHEYDIQIRRSEVRIPVLVQVFLLGSYNVKFPKAQTMGLVSINNWVYFVYWHLDNIPSIS